MKPENVNLPENLFEFRLSTDPGKPSDISGYAEEDSAAADNPMPDACAKAEEAVLPATPAHPKSITIL